MRGAPVITLKAKDPRETVAFRLPSSLKTKLLAIAKKEKVEPTQVFEAACRAFVADYEKNGAVVER